jgi:hypothetical protein
MPTTKPKAPSRGPVRRPSRASELLVQFRLRGDSHIIVWSILIALGIAGIDIDL